MKNILSWLYQLAEAKFTLGVFPSPAVLRYFDNTNNVPVNYGTPTTFNNEPADFWLGFDTDTLQLCVANYNRTVIICCFQPI